MCGVNFDFLLFYYATASCLHCTASATPVQFIGISHFLLTYISFILTIPSLAYTETNTRKRQPPTPSNGKPTVSDPDINPISRSVAKKDGNTSWQVLLSITRWSVWLTYILYIDTWGIYGWHQSQANLIGEYNRFYVSLFISSNMATAMPALVLQSQRYPQLNLQVYNSNGALLACKSR